MMADPSHQFSQHPHRRPLPHLQSERERSYSPGSQVSTAYSHSRTRTTSSSVFPFAPQQSSPNTMSTSPFPSKRTPSNATFSTSGSGNLGLLPQRQPSTDLRRSISSRSGASLQPSSYVALMRKQKATVWCDRAQHEDPRLLAAQRAAKMRAHQEVVGGATHRTTTLNSTSLSNSNRVAAKIRHHGKASLVGYSPGTHFGVGGVPMRLSATEVEGGDSDDDAESGTGQVNHQRSGSGRSSVSSARRGMAYARQSGTSLASGRLSVTHTPPSESEGTFSTTLNEHAEKTPIASTHPRPHDYFPSTDGSNHRPGSASSGERADGLGELTGSDAARFASNRLLKSTITREKSTKNPDELRRRGSVDDRTMTLSLSAGRLFVANPDVDSD